MGFETPSIGQENLNIEKVMSGMSDVLGKKEEEITEQFNKALEC